MKKESRKKNRATSVLRFNSVDCKDSLGMRKISKKIRLSLSRFSKLQVDYYSKAKFETFTGWSNLAPKLLV